MKYRGRVLGLILLSPLCRAPSWIEWFYNKSAQGVSASTVLQQEIAELDIVEACRRLLNERHSTNFLRFLQAINKRPDLPHGLKRLKCGSLIFVEENTPFHYEALHMTSKLDRRYSALVEVQAYGSMVTEEQPHAMLIRMEYFFMGYGFYRPCYLNGSPRSPLTPSCIAPEILSPESMCLKLKPIKTRVKLDVQVEENGRI